MRLITRRDDDESYERVGEISFRSEIKVSHAFPWNQPETRNYTRVAHAPPCCFGKTAKTTSRTNGYYLGNDSEDG